MCKSFQHTRLDRSYSRLLSHSVIAGSVSLLEGHNVRGQAAAAGQDAGTMVSRGWGRGCRSFSEADVPQVPPCLLRGGSARHSPGTHGESLKPTGEELFPRTHAAFSIASQDAASAHPGLVGQLAPSVLMPTLGEEGCSADLAQACLELLLVVFQAGDHAAAARRAAAGFVSNSAWVASLLVSTASPDIWTRLLSIQVLQSLHSVDAKGTVGAMLSCGAGMMKLLEALRDAREEVRNEALLLLVATTEGNSEMQTFVAFQDAFSALASIVEAEAYRGIVVGDCLLLLGNLVLNNDTSQKLFVESPALPCLVACLQPQADDVSAGGMSDPARAALGSCLSIIQRCTQCSLAKHGMLSGSQSGADELAAAFRARQRTVAAVQEALGAAAGLLERVSCLATDPAAPSSINVQAMLALAGLVDGHEGNQGRTALQLMPAASAVAAAGEGVTNPAFGRPGAAVLTADAHAAIQAGKQSAVALVLLWTSIMRTALLGAEEPTVGLGLGGEVQLPSPRRAAWHCVRCWTSAAATTGRGAGDTTAVSSLSHVLAPPPVVPPPGFLPASCHPSAYDAPAPIVPPCRLLVDVMHASLRSVSSHCSQETPAAFEHGDGAVLAATCAMLAIVLGNSATAREVASAISVPAVTASTPPARVSLFHCIVDVLCQVLVALQKPSSPPGILAAALPLVRLVLSWLEGDARCVHQLWTHPAAAVLVSAIASGASHGDEEGVCAGLTCALLMQSVLCAAAAGDEADMGSRPGLLAFIKTKSSISAVTGAVTALAHHAVLAQASTQWQAACSLLPARSEEHILAAVAQHAGEAVATFSGRVLAAEDVLWEVQSQHPQGSPPLPSLPWSVAPASVFVGLRALQAAFRQAIVASFLTPGAQVDSAAELDPTTAAELVAGYQDIIRSQLGELESLRSSVPGLEPSHTHQPASVLRLQAELEQEKARSAALLRELNARGERSPASDSPAGADPQALQAAQARAAQAEARAMKAETQIQVLQADIEALSGSVEAPASVSPPESLQALHAVEQRARDAEAACEEARAAAARSESKAAQHKTASEAAQARISQLATELGTLRAELEELREYREHSSSQAQVQHEATSTLRHALARAEEAVASERAAKEHAEDALTGLESDKAELQASLNRAAQECDSLRTQLALAAERAGLGGQRQSEHTVEDGMSVGGLSTATAFTSLQAEHEDLLVLLAEQDFEHAAFEEALHSLGGAEAVLAAKREAKVAMELATCGEGDAADCSVGVFSEEATSDERQRGRHAAVDSDLPPPSDTDAEHVELTPRKLDLSARPSSPAADTGSSQAAGGELPEVTQCPPDSPCRPDCTVPAAGACGGAEAPCVALTSQQSTSAPEHSYAGAGLMSISTPPQQDLVEVPLDTPSHSSVSDGGEDVTALTLEAEVPPQQHANQAPGAALLLSVLPGGGPLSGSDGAPVQSVEGDAVAGHDEMPSRDHSPGQVEVLPATSSVMTPEDGEDDEGSSSCVPADPTQPAPQAPQAPPAAHLPVPKEARGEAEGMPPSSSPSRDSSPPAQESLTPPSVGHFGVVAPAGEPAGLASTVQPAPRAPAPAPQPSGMGLFSFSWFGSQQEEQRDLKDVFEPDASDSFDGMSPAAAADRVPLPASEVVLQQHAGPGSVQEVAASSHAAATPSASAFFSPAAVLPQTRAPASRRPMYVASMPEQVPAAHAPVEPAAAPPSLTTPSSVQSFDKPSVVSTQHVEAAAPAFETKPAGPLPYESGQPATFPSTDQTTQPALGTQGGHSADLSSMFGGGGGSAKPGGGVASWF